MTTVIACSPLTGRIYQGRVDKARESFVGEKKDVTSDVLKSLLEKAAYHGGPFDIEGGGRKWTVKVEEQLTPTKREQLRNDIAADNAISKGEEQI